MVPPSPSLLLAATSHIHQSKSAFACSDLTAVVTCCAVVSRLVYDTKGRFVVHRITPEEASYKLCKVKRMQFGKGGIPYIATHDGRTIRYPDPEVRSSRFRSSTQPMLEESVQTRQRAAIGDSSSS